LAFPKPDIAAAVDQIEESRRDLIAPLAEIISHSVPLGGVSAPILSRLIFPYLAGGQSASLSTPAAADSCRSSALSSSSPQFAFSSAFSPARV
jgi:hypothetical protein